MKKVPKICQHLESKAHENQRVSKDQTFPGGLKIDGQNQTAVIRSEVEPNPPDEEEVEIDETKSNSVETEMPNDGNSQTQEDVMPSNVGNSETQKDVMPLMMKICKLRNQWLLFLIVVESEH